MIPVIFSGGSGTRLWPVSRASYPKQFCEFYDQSFLKNSIERLSHFGKPLILTLETMKDMSVRTLGESKQEIDQVITEPMGKNTGPAAALMCHILEQRGLGDQVMGVFPADHLILDKENFKKAIDLAIEDAGKGQVVTLGIEPRFAATGYGYIEITDEVDGQQGDLKSYKVKQFCEKPELKVAEEFIQTGRHFWNSGMFIFRVDVMIDLFKKHQPDIWQKIAKIEPDMSNAKYNYANIESISLDYAIMEKIENISCIPCDLGWSDVGSWDEIARLAEEMPEFRGESKANVFSEEATSNYVFSLRNKVVSLVGVRNLVVVDTPDALLISSKGKTEKVKEIVKSVQEAGLTEAMEHPFELRPWGRFEILSDDPEFKAKKITVDPGAKLSYQSHEKRDEHWIMISGKAEVTLNDEVKAYNPGEHVFIKRQSKHRIHNVGSEPLIFVEVQTGLYFGEDDIVRYQDDYSRVEQ